MVLSQTLNATFHKTGQMGLPTSPPPTSAAISQIHSGDLTRGYDRYEI